MRISDWSSDVCSSDLGALRQRRPHHAFRGHDRGGERADPGVPVPPPGEGRVHLPVPLDAGRGRLLGQPLHPAQSDQRLPRLRSEEHTYELQSLMRISYAVLRLKKKKKVEMRK